jgi:DNA topoisomerase-1
MGAIFGSLDRDDDVLAIGLNRAVDLVARKMASVRTIGMHPADKEPIAVRKGRFGPYVQHGKTVANLPRGVVMDDVTLDEAIALLAEKGKVLKARGAAGRKGRSAANVKGADTRKAPRKQAAPAETRGEHAPKTQAAPAKKKAGARKTAAKARKRAAE